MWARAAGHSARAVGVQVGVIALANDVSQVVVRVGVPERGPRTGRQARPRARRAEQALERVVLIHFSRSRARRTRAEPECAARVTKVEVLLLLGDVQEVIVRVIRLADVRRGGASGRNGLAQTIGVHL